MSGRRLSAAQERVLARLEAGEVIYAWNGVSRVTAFALVDSGRAEWAVEPHTVREPSNARGSRTRYQLEWGLRAKPRVYCTVPGHQPGEHGKNCLPAADPADPELRLLRAIYGLCSQCDREDPHEHEEST